MSTLLLGGGLDSVAYLILLHKKIDSCIVIDYGQHSYKGEEASAEYFCNKYSKPLHKVKNSQILRYNKCYCQLFTGNTEHNAYVNGRNISFILQALEIDDCVYLGFTDPGYAPFPDADEEFIRDINLLLSRVFNKVSILAPYIDINRGIILQEAYKLDNELFDKSFTCWISNNIDECGHCKHCLLKEEQKRKILSL